MFEQMKMDMMQEWIASSLKEVPVKVNFQCVVYIKKLCEFIYALITILLLGLCEIGKKFFMCWTTPHAKEHIISDFSSSIQVLIRNFHRFQSDVWYYLGLNQIAKRTQ